MLLEVIVHLTSVPCEWDILPSICYISLPSAHSLKSSKRGKRKTSTKILKTELCNPEIRKVGKKRKSHRSITSARECYLSPEDRKSPTTGWA